MQKMAENAGEPVLSMERFSTPSPWIGSPELDHSVGFLPLTMFGIRTPGLIPIVQGPLPEMEVTICGSSCVAGICLRPFPWPEPPVPFELSVPQIGEPE